MDIYVGNLPYSITGDDLRNLFSQYGAVSDAKVISDKYSGKSKGFGFVQMDDNDSAENAIKSLNDTDFKGRNIKVNQAKPKERSDRPRQDRY